MKQKLPRLRILAAVEALDPFADFMRQGLDVASAWSTREGPLVAALYAFASGDLLVVEPREDGNPVADFLKTRGPGFVAFGPAEGLVAGGPPLCGSGPLAMLGLIGLPESGLLLLGGHAPALEVRVSEQDLDLDHIAFVVGDLDPALAEIKAHSGSEASAELGQWRFPDFMTTSAFLLFEGAYVELSRPWSDQGPFGAQYAKSKAGAMFVCLRSTHPEATLARLASAGITRGEAIEINGLPPGHEPPHRLGQVYGLPRRATQKLTLSLFDTAWPGDYLSGKSTDCGV